MREFKLKQDTFPELVQSQIDNRRDQTFDIAGSLPNYYVSKKVKQKMQISLDPVIAAQWGLLSTTYSKLCRKQKGYTKEERPLVKLFKLGAEVTKDYFEDTESYAITYYALFELDHHQMYEPIARQRVLSRQFDHIRKLFVKRIALTNHESEVYQASFSTIWKMLDDYDGANALIEAAELDGENDYVSIYKAALKNELGEQFRISTLGVSRRTYYRMLERATEYAVQFYKSQDINAKVPA